MSTIARISHATQGVRYDWECDTCHAQLPEHGARAAGWEQYEQGGKPLRCPACLDAEAAGQEEANSCSTRTS